jgi:hypothetical protein
MFQKLSLVLACLLVFSATQVMAQTSTTTTLPFFIFCEGNFDCDQDVDGTDAFTFKSDFGRSVILNPCSVLDDCPTPWNPCPDGMWVCGWACIDPMTDEANCGGCNIACNGTCVNGLCQQDNLLPDLIIQKMVVDPIQPAVGQSATIEITVKNQGQATSGVCWLDWYWDLDIPPIPGQAGDQYNQVPVLAPSETYTWQTHYDYDWASDAGDRNMYAFVDTFSEMAESIEDNNVYGPYGYHVAEGCAGTLSPLGRWCDQHNGTVKDMTTGLVWLKDAGWGGTYPLWASLGTADAHHRAASLWDGSPYEGTAGLSDGSWAGEWRLPTVREFGGIAMGTEYIRSSQMYFFTGVQSTYYWSGTSYPYDPIFAYIWNMSDGTWGYTDKRAIYYVWPVRSDN